MQVVTGLTVTGLAFKRFAASSSSFYMLFQGEALLSEDTVTDGPTTQAPGMAGAASTRTSKAKERGGVVSFPDDLVPVLRSPCRCGSASFASVCRLYTLQETARASNGTACRRLSESETPPPPSLPSAGIARSCSIWCWCFLWWSARRGTPRRSWPARRRCT